MTPSAVATSAETAAKLRTNLPQPLPGLLGREDDLALLGELIDQHRLVSVVGAGGIGKTLLAQHLLDMRRNSYPHGVCWVELTAVTDPALIPATLIAALGVLPGAGEPLDELCAALAPLKMLVAIDNAEHLLAEVAAVAKSLMTAAADVRLLVTSQAPLKLAAEWIYRIGPLAVPPGPLSATRALDFSAVALFVERARSVDGRFVFNDTVAPVVIQLCQQLDGLALAIEFAAARAPMLGVQRLAHSMHDRLRLLNTSRVRDAPARQQTLLAALEWSHGFLNEREQAVFRRLAVFVGSASLEAIQCAVTDPEGELNKWAVIDALGVLVDRSLVVTLTNDYDTNPRYRFLETPRTYALERLRDAGEEAVMSRRHAVAVAAQLDAAYDTRYSGKVGIDEWFATVALDIDNAREALAWAHDAGEPQIELQTIAWLLLALPSSLLSERMVLADRCEALITSDVPARLQCRAWGELGRVWVNKNRRRGHNAAQQNVRLARELNDQEPDRFRLYKALCDLVRTFVHVGDVDEEAAILAEAREIEDPAWPPHRLIWRVRAEAFVAGVRGDAVENLRLTRSVLELERASGMHNPLTLCDLVDAELAAGDAAAAACAGMALVNALAGTRNELHLAYAQLNLAAAWLTMDDVAQALAVAQAGWPLGLRFELQPYWADYLALMAMLEGRPRTAARLAGYADAGYAGREQDRAHNETAAIERARALARTALGDAEFDRLSVNGGALQDGEIATLAFATEDSVGRYGAG